MGKTLFGTDGIRGVAGEYPLDAATVHAFGVALARDVCSAKPGAEILIGTDTRESGPWIAETVAAGLVEGGARVRYAGVITTPGVAYLTRTDDFVAGVMISASHNPYRDNGIKVFSHSGFKLPDEEEDQVEQAILRLRVEDTGGRHALAVDESLDQRYLEFLISTATARLDGMRLVLDCGNGAAWRLGPELFRRLGANVSIIGAAPDGRNINLSCGSLHIEGLQREVVTSGADFGVAFDGDADRAIFVSSRGQVVDGDAVLLIAARALKAAGRLDGGLVVATVMSNLGFETALARDDIRLLRTPVGDKYVIEEMVRTGAVLGGEQSGHVIFRQYATTGDGLLTALRVFEIARRAGKGFEALTAGFKLYPQKLVNVRVKHKRALTEVPSVAREIQLCERAFGASGRVLVRFSGTEPLARVMVEGPDLHEVEDFSARIADAIRREMGA